MQPREEWLRRPDGLAQRLRALRSLAGLTGEQLAQQAGEGWDRPRVSKIENGRQMPSDDDIRTWTRVTGHPEEAPGLLAMAAQGRALHTEWKHQVRAGHAAVQADFNTLVGDATTIRNFQIMVVPGLLQTPPYARSAMLQAVTLAGTDPSRIDEAVAARMSRQTVLYEPGRTFDFVFTQAALDYPLCPRDVMAGQIDRLVGLVGVPSISLGIIPAGTELAITPQVGFMLADDTAIVETYTSADTITGQEATTYQDVFQLLKQQAVSGDEARHLLAAAAVRLNR